MLKARKSFVNSKNYSYLCIAKQKNNAPWCNGNTTGFGPVVMGSSPVGASIHRCSSVGRVRGLGPRCRRFESCHLYYQKFKLIKRR